MDTKGLMFPKPKDLENKKSTKSSSKKSNRSIACDIPREVRKKVLVRDKGMCIICGQPGLPNSHYIRRSKGGLGIEENVVCMCIDCHNAYDNGSDSNRKEFIQKKTKKYLKGKYGKDWKEEKLIYKK